jgi:hypothetical protein
MRKKLDNAIEHGLKNKVLVGSTTLAFSPEEKNYHREEDEVPCTFGEKLIQQKISSLRQEV